MTKTYAVVDTSAGHVGLVVSSRGLRRLTLPYSTRDAALAELGQDLDGADENSAQLQDLVRRIRQYFEGQDVDLSGIPLDLAGHTTFQRAVLEAVRGIARGSVRTYGQVAASAGRPGAARAVGAVMAANPVCIVVPCHRVIGADGSLTGFGGGLDMKRRMLELEGAHLTIRRPAAILGQREPASPQG